MKRALFFCLTTSLALALGGGRAHAECGLPDPDDDGERPRGAGWHAPRHGHVNPVDDDRDDEAAEEDDDGSEHDLATQLPVEGPIALRLETVSADVMVTASAGRFIAVHVEEGSAPEVTVVARGEHRYELVFGGHAVLRSGRLMVTVPAQSQLEISTVSGDVAVNGVGGHLRVRSTSGDQRVAGALDVDARSISGDLSFAAIHGAVHVRTISGDVRVLTTPGTVGRLDVTSTSGDIQWSGLCGRDCRIDARTTSGDVQLALDPASSFDLVWCTHSGDLDDAAQLAIAERTEGSARGRRGRGEGAISVETFSGDLAMAVR